MPEIKVHLPSQDGQYCLCNQNNIRARRTPKPTRPLAEFLVTNPLMRCKKCYKIYLKNYA